MSIVVNKTLTGSLPVGNGSVQIIYSANTPDYSEFDWYINPDISSVQNINLKYWKIINDNLLPMTLNEQNTVDEFLSQENTSIVYINSITNDIQSNTTSNYNQIKIQLNTDSLLLGIKYKIEWYCEIGASKTNKQVVSNVLLNDEIIATTSSYRLLSSNKIFQSFSGYYYSNQLNGINSIKLVYYDESPSASGYVSIKNAKILVSKL